LALSSTASAQFSPGARTVGSVYYTQVGNGGYDAQHYDVTIKYDPIAHVFNSASTKLTARATQGLSEFSLDFVGYYDISGITVNGAPATSVRVGEPVAVRIDAEAPGRGVIVEVLADLDASGARLGDVHVHPNVMLTWHHRRRPAGTFVDLCVIQSRDHVPLVE
jgi:hypothetical protein